MGPAREAVRACVELGEGDDAIFVEDGGAFRALAGPALDPIGDGELCAGMHGAGHRKRASGCGDIDRFPAYRIG